MDFLKFELKLDYGVSLVSPRDLSHSFYHLLDIGNYPFQVLFILLEILHI